MSQGRNDSVPDFQPPLTRNTMPRPLGAEGVSTSSVRVLPCRSP